MQKSVIALLVMMGTNMFILFCCSNILVLIVEGTPSQKLVSRMIKEQKIESTERKKVETVAEDLLSQLNFAGQSPRQIRDR